MLCNRPTCTETGAALALPGTLQERDTPAPPRAGVVTLPLPIRLRSCAGRAAGPTPAAEPQPGSHREPGARESQYPDILAMFVAGTIIRDRYGSLALASAGSPAGTPGPGETNGNREFRPDLGKSQSFFPCSGSPPLPLLSTGCQNPALVLLPAPGCDFCCFRNAYRGSNTSLYRRSAPKHTSPSNLVATSDPVHYNAVSATGTTKPLMYFHVVVNETDIGGYVMARLSTKCWYT